ncbi:hypothetical protein O6P43_017879 [Quillaja saponaria]|uniref:Uncharacterized protein n=1 Tax=Quillaja saponaria TaxID=32244 RepID=A0AAD7LRE6_QUISA|nr:hypothetical protein O6P43_017879 [Quillaja saponaria]
MSKGQANIGTLSNKELLSCIDPMKSAQEPTEKKERARAELACKLLTSRGRLRSEFNFDKEGEVSLSDCKNLHDFSTQQFMSSTGGNYTLTQCWQNVMHELFQMKSELKSKEMKLRRMPQNHMHASNNIHNHIFLLQQQQQQQQQLGRRGMINPNMYMIHQRRHRPLNQDQILPLPRTKLQVPAAGAGFNFDNNHALLPMNPIAAPTTAAGGTAFDNSGEQNLEGLINQNGQVSGTANGSIFILNNCNFHPPTPSHSQ